MDGVVPSLLIETSGLFVESPLPLNSISISGCIDRLVASIALSYRFGPLESEDDTIYGNEAVFKLIWPDFGATVTGFKAVVDGEVVSSQITESSNTYSKAYRQHAPSSASNQYTAVMRNLQKCSTAQLTLHFVKPLQFSNAQLQLHLPVLIIPHILDSASNGQTSIPAGYGTPLRPTSLQVDLALQLPSSISKISSPSHPIILDTFHSHNSSSKSKNEPKKGEIPISAVQRLVLAPKTVQEFVTPMQPFILAMDIDSEAPCAMLPQFEWLGEPNRDACNVLLPLRPSLPFIRTHAEIQIVIDTCRTPIPEILRSVRAVIRNEAFSSVWLNFVFLSKLGPQFAFPRPTTLSSETTTKLLSILDIWKSNALIQGCRSPNTGSMKSAFSAILKRFSPDTEAPRHILLISNLISSGMASIEPLLPVLNDVSVFPLAVGLDADYFALKDLATSTNGHLEHAWTHQTLQSQLKTQLSRCLQPTLRGARLLLKATSSDTDHSEEPLLTVSPKMVPIAPAQSSIVFANELLYFFASFEKQALDNFADQQLKVELVGEWQPQGAKRPTIAPIENVSLSFQLSGQSKALQESISPHLGKNNLFAYPIATLGHMEQILDQEAGTCESNELVPWALRSQALNVRQHFHTDRQLSGGRMVALFNVSELDFLEYSDNRTSEPILSSVPTALDLSALLKLKSTGNAKPASLAYFSPRASSESSGAPSTPPMGRKGSDPHRRKHGSTSKAKVRPTLTIQGVWADARLDATASKAMSHYQQWFKTMNSTLNKLTSENFETLAPKILVEVQAELADPFSMKGFTGLVYDKAVRQRPYAALYANLIRYLVDNIPFPTDILRRSLLDKVRSEFEIAITPKELLSTLATTANNTTPTNTENPEASPSIPSLASPRDSTAHSTTTKASSSQNGNPEPANNAGPQRPRFFNSKLESSSPSLSRSSDIFKSEQNRLNAYTEDEEEKENKARELRSGLVVFLGKLYKKGIVSVDIAQHCVGELMSKALHHQSAYPVKSTECLTLATKYIQVIGKHLQKDNPTVIEKLFTYIDTEILENPSLENMNRVLFTNLIELRQNNWIRREKTPIGTSTPRDMRRSGFR